MIKYIILIMLLSLPALAQRRAGKSESRQTQAASKSSSGFKLGVGAYGLYGVGSMGNSGTISNRDVEYYTGGFFTGFSYSKIRLALNGEYQSVNQKKDPASLGNSNISGLSLNSGLRVDYVGEGFSIGAIYKLSDQYKFFAQSSGASGDNSFSLGSGYSVQFIKKFGRSNWGIILDYTLENLKNIQMNENLNQSRTALGFVWSNF